MNWHPLLRLYSLKISVQMQVVPIPVHNQRLLMECDLPAAPSLSAMCPSLPVHCPPQSTVLWKQL